jgi:cell division protein FtsB
MLAMNVMRFRRYDLVVCLACLALLSSFAWYGYQGPRGFAYGDALAETFAALQADNAKLEDEKLALEKRVALLRPEHVDRDLLEELARQQLNMAAPGSLVVLQKPLN